MIKNFGEAFLRFSDSSPTPFHCCKTASLLLESVGFQRITETEPWELKKGGKYYFTRNGSSLCAFMVGKSYNVGNAFKMVGAHSDSPVLKVKPVSKREGYGVEQVGVETYGGGLWHTWFDRDLGIAGRLIIREQDDSFTQKLIHVKDPILRVPTLALHLQSSSEQAAFVPNTEEHLTPVLSLMNEMINGNNEELDQRHSPTLLNILAKEGGCDANQIVDFELTLCDSQPSCMGGAAQEFVFAPRLDNQLHCFLSIQALVAAASKDSEDEEGINVALLFDHEEVGSRSNEGAASPLLRDTIQRILFNFYVNDIAEKKASATTTVEELFKITLAKSIFFSADCAHAIHPNYASRHEKNHGPVMGKGMVIKTNMSQKYATNSVTGFFVRELARQNKVGYFAQEGIEEFVEIPVQEFVVRNDQPSGSTIGPITAAGSGLRTVDIGLPQLSMHSIREQCSVDDLWSGFHLLQAFYQDGVNVDKKLSPTDTLLF